MCPTANSGRLLRLVTLDGCPDPRLEALVAVLSRIILPLLLPVIALVCAAVPAEARAPHAYERQVIAATNDVRTDRHMSALRPDACLARFASAHARRMGARGTLVHQDLRRVLRTCGLARVAENVAVGYRDGRSTVRDGWMNSAGHRHNILTRSHRVTAIGAARVDGRWWTVQLLGSR